VPPDDRDGHERLARYLLRPPVSLERLHVDEHAQAVAYAARCKPGLQAPTAAAPADPKEFLARVVMHIPEPRRHVIRYYGAYSDEIDGLIRGLDAVAKVDRSANQMAEVRADDRTRDGLEFSTFSGAQQVRAAISCGHRGRGTTFFQRPELVKLKDIVVQAKTTLDSPRQ
jgi:hypothetical protein